MEINIDLCAKRRCRRQEQVITTHNIWTDSELLSVGPSGKKTSVKFESKHKISSWRKSCWKCRLHRGNCLVSHYIDVIMGAMASQITSLTIVYSTVYSAQMKEKSKLRVTGLCAGNSLETGEFPAQMASNAENVSIAWHHHECMTSQVDQDLNGKVYIDGLVQEIRNSITNANAMELRLSCTDPSISWQLLVFSVIQSRRSSLNSFCLFCSPKWWQGLSAAPQLVPAVSCGSVPSSNPAWSSTAASVTDRPTWTWRTVTVDWTYGSAMYKTFSNSQRKIEFHIHRYPQRHCRYQCIKYICTYISKPWITANSCLLFFKTWVGL